MDIPHSSWIAWANAAHGLLIAFPLVLSSTKICERSSFGMVISSWAYSMPASSIVRMSTGTKSRLHDGFSTSIRMAVASVRML